MKGALNAPDGKRSHSQSYGQNGREASKGRSCETLAGMKGWRPSALCIGLETGSGLLRANSMPDIGSIGLPLSTVLGLMVHGPRFPFSRSSGSAAAGSGKGPPRVRDHEKAPALHSRRETVGPETKTEGATNDFKENEQPRRCSFSRAGSGPKREKRAWGSNSQTGRHREEAEGRRGDPGDRRAPQVPLDRHAASRLAMTERRSCSDASDRTLLGSYVAV